MTRPVPPKPVIGPLSAGPHFPRRGIGWLLAAIPVLALSAGEAQVPPSASAGDAVTSYLDAISDAEAMGGSYSAELGDLYLGLGKSLVEVGDLKAAREAFQQGVTVARVNYGPQGLEQTNYLYSIADIETQLGEYQTANNVLQNIYLINVRNHGEDSPAMLPALEQLYAWYFDPVNPRAAPHTYSDFQNGSFLAHRLASLTEAENGIGDSATGRRYRDLGQLQFQAIRFLSAAAADGTIELESDMDWSEDERRQEAFLFNHYRTGMEAFAKTAESWRENPAATDLERAEALAQLGDWYLIFGKPDSAEDYYLQAHELLAGSPEYSAVADRYMGEPTPVRFMLTEEPFARNIDEPYPEDGLEISMSVTRTGDLQNIRVLNAAEGDAERVLKIVRRELRSTRFRPGLINGKTAKVDDYFYRFSIVPKENQENEDNKDSEDDEESQG